MRRLVKRKGSANDKSLLTGNLSKLVKRNPKRQGWFFGHFIEEDHPFHSKDFELKWVEQKEGWKKRGFLENNSKTIVILISGDFKITFDRGKRSFALSKRGDFIYYKTAPHLGESKAGCLLLVVRWPSRKE